MRGEQPRPRPGGRTLIGGGPPTYPAARPGAGAPAPPEPELPLSPSPEPRLPRGCLAAGAIGCTVAFAPFVLCLALVLPTALQRASAARYAVRVRECVKPCASEAQGLASSLAVLLKRSDIADFDLGGFAADDAQALAERAEKLRGEARRAQVRLAELAPPAAAQGAHEALRAYLGAAARFAGDCADELRWYARAMNVACAARVLFWRCKTGPLAARGEEDEREAILSALRALERETADARHLPEAQAAERAIARYVAAVAEYSRAAHARAGGEGGASEALREAENLCAQTAREVSDKLCAWAQAAGRLAQPLCRAAAQANRAVDEFHRRAQVMAEDRIPHIPLAEWAGRAAAGENISPKGASN